MLLRQDAPCFGLDGNDTWPSDTDGNGDSAKSLRTRDKLKQMDAKTIHITFIGGGNMAQAILSAYPATDHVPPTLKRPQAQDDVKMKRQQHPSPWLPGTSGSLGSPTPSSRLLKWWCHQIKEINCLQRATMVAKGRP
jgi:hypothetical protein